MREYDRVQAHNHPGAPAKERQMLSILRSLSGGAAGDSKSAMFSRLLNGKPVLLHAPPVAWSYPWYEAVEGDGPFEVEAEIVPHDVAVAEAEEWVSSAEEYVADDHHVHLPGNDPDTLRNMITQLKKKVELMRLGNLPGVRVYRRSWETVEVVREGAEYIITYGAWADMGFRWRLSLDRVPSSSSTRVICCWHDKHKTRVTTVDELWAESRWHVMREVQGLRDAHEARALDVNLKDRSDWFAALAQAEEVSVAQESLLKRIQAGKPPVPSPEEIEVMVQDRYNDYLSSHGHHFGELEAGEDGILYVRAWRLARIAPVELPGQIWFEHQAFTAP